MISVRDLFQDRVERVNRAMDASENFYWKFATGIFATHLLYSMVVAVFSGWHLHNDILYYIWWHSGRLYFPSFKWVIAANIGSLIAMAAYVEWVAPAEDHLQLLEVDHAD
jgi:hypothetical protein